MAERTDPQPLPITRQPASSAQSPNELDTPTVFTFDRHIQITGAPITTSELKADHIEIEHDFDKSPSVSPGYSPRIVRKNGYSKSENSGSVKSNQGSPANFKESLKVYVGMYDSERRRERHHLHDGSRGLSEEELKRDISKEIVSDPETQPPMINWDLLSPKQRLMLRFHRCTHPVDPPYRYMCGGKCGYNANVCLHMTTCLCFVRGLFYHMYIDEEIDEDFTSADAPCACTGPHCLGRWGCLAASSIIMPCLCCYIPLRCCMEPCGKAEADLMKKYAY
ncbi:protein sprouty homolog 4-like [Lineus longissimus]|uniref:protein sprouty homolog 4-like n=1 Tax=Lineus longissimus TaxID=88925 RepID=UPI00315C5EAB